MESELKRIELKETKTQKSISLLGVLCFLFKIIGFIFGVYGYFVFDMKSDKGIESFGNYASGTVVGLWSLAGVILILRAFLVQKLELLFQKEELKLNRKELEETR